LYAEFGTCRGRKIEDSFLEGEGELKKIRGIPLALLLGVVTAFAVVAPAAAQTVSVNTSASASVDAGGVTGALGSVTGLLGGLGL
jgi:hypothetical protein